MENKLLTREECVEILKTQYFKGLILGNYEIIPATEAHGFLGEYYRLILYCRESENNTEKSDHVKLIFFVKSIPRQSAEIEKAEIFRKEAELYATLLKDLQKYYRSWNSVAHTQFCPTSYYTRPDLFVLQDLCSFGFEKCRNAGKDLTDAELKAILNTLAALHGASIALEERTGLSIENSYPADILKEITIAPNIAWCTTGLKTILDLAKLHPSYQTEPLKHFVTSELKVHLNGVYEMLNPSKKYRNVLCHRDPWLANVLFNYETMSAVLVDFQTCRYCPPAIDVLMAIVLNMDCKLRTAFEEDYLMWYYERLKCELSRQDIDIECCLPVEELLSSYKDFKLFALLYRAIVVTLIDVPEDFITNDYKYVERTEKLLSYMEFNTDFRCRLELCIAEVLDYVLEKNERNKV